MLRKAVSMLVLLTFFLQFGCGTMYNIPKEEFTNQYINKKKSPSIIVKTLYSSYKIPYDSYYLNSDTIYFDVNVVEVPGEKYPDTDKIAMQDVQSIEIAGTNLLLAPVVLLAVGVVFIGIILLTMLASEGKVI
jgi:hypothetical protein